MKGSLSACWVLALANGRISATDSKGRLILCLGYLLSMWLLYCLWSGLYTDNPHRAGMTFSSALLHVVTAQTLFAIITTGADWRLAREIRSGEVANQLTQPINLVLRHAALSLGVAGAKALYFLPAFALFLYFSGLHLTPVSWLFALVSVLCSFSLLFTLGFVVGLAGFLATDLWGITASKDAVVQFLGGALIPLGFFPSPIQQLLTWLPFAHFFHTPVAYLTGQQTSMSALCIQLVWVLVFWGIAQLAGRWVQRKLVVFGA
ncbi:ABC-2 family transporter protein [Chitiniphilus purpureus]|uniref:ABC-2 family transporter protein n=1 Tax=Chitiniphilus purpureus TaxID=2981137 RepID=A0ABY6DVC7_9NEIS|nr:ABC-2 family transporter protein [Chitiniphilus sp. CD1]UXY15808.1 ABC-2 family transporter protein [Chitiniphilus sp. CD1]